MQSSQEFDDVESLIREGSEEVSRRNISKAIDKYQEAYEIAKKSGRQEVIVSCACNLGAALLSQGGSDQAIEYLEHAVRTLEAEKLQQTETLNGDLLFNLGLAHAMKKDYHAAVRYFSSAAEVFKECSDFKGFSDSCQQLGEQNVKLAQPLKAAACFRDASEGYLNSGRVFLAGKMVVRQAQNLHDGGNTEEGLGVLLKLEDLYSQIQSSTADSGKVAKLLCDAGSILFHLRSPENASKWLNQALNVTRSLDSSDSSTQKLQARILLALGEVCSVLRDYTNAVMINKEASILYGKLENKKCRGQCFYQLAEAYRHLGDNHNAEKYYHIAYQTLEDAGLHSYLWQVLEGLADLNYQRRQLDTSISYYKETITQLGHRGAPPLLQREIVTKLATALEVQRVGVVKAASYKNRVPVLIQPEQDLHVQMRESVQNATPDVPLIQSPIYAPLSSTRLSLYSSVDHSSLDNNTTLKVPGKRKKRKSKRHGRRRSGSFDKPVTRGVGEYDTETDISLVKGRIAKMARTASKNRSKSSRSRVDGERPAILNKSAPRRLLSHIKGLEIDEDGAAPPISSVDDSTQVDPTSPRMKDLLKGLNTASFSDSDYVIARGRSASQTALTEGDTSSSSSDDDGEDDSLTEVSSEEDGTGSASEDDSEDDSNSSEEELKYLDERLRSRLSNTYEQPSTDEPMYATIKSRKLLSGQGEEKLYETLNTTASTAVLTSTMPTRAPPALPSPPEPPRGPRPSQGGSSSQPWDQPRPAGALWSGPTYPESSVMSSMSRGEREMGLYQVARLTQERKTALSSRSSMSSATSEAKVPKSKACVVM